jgi:hypothetical protein
MSCAVLSGECCSRPSLVRTGEHHGHRGASGLTLQHCFSSKATLWSVTTLLPWSNTVTAMRIGEDGGCGASSRLAGQAKSCKLVSLFGSVGARILT